MILVRIELHSARTGKVTELGRMIIENDGLRTKTVHDKRGDYNARILRRGSWSKVTHTARVEDFPRKAYVIWRLVARLLLSAFPEEARHAATEYRRFSTAT